MARYSHVKVLDPRPTSVLRLMSSTWMWARSPILAIVLAIVITMSNTAPSAANARYAAIVVDATTGEVLFSRAATTRRFPASITKVMTLYILFEELEAERLKLDSPLSVSHLAARQPPTKAGVRPGDTISVKDALGLLITRSANDVAVVVAENVSGDVPSFADRMTSTARAIGMGNTTFKNPHGLPDSGQTTTAEDIATLATTIQNRFPQYYTYFGLRSYAYAGVEYRNHNRLLEQMDGIEGLKTGFTRASGFNLVSSLRREGKHIIGVVLGGKSGARRDTHMREILENALPQAKPSEDSAPPTTSERKDKHTTQSS